MPEIYLFDPRDGALPNNPLWVGGDADNTPLYELFDTFVNQGIVGDPGIYILAWKPDPSSLNGDVAIFPITVKEAHDGELSIARGYKDSSDPTPTNITRWPPKS